MLADALISGTGRPGVNWIDRELSALFRFVSQQNLLTLGLKPGPPIVGGLLLFDPFEQLVDFQRREM